MTISESTNVKIEPSVAHHSIVDKGKWEIKLKSVDGELWVTLLESHGGDSEWKKRCFKAKREQRIKSILD